jgi:hypothetical protein
VRHHRRPGSALLDQSIRLRRQDEKEPDDSPSENRRPVSFVFVASSPDAIRVDLGDRRFAVTDLTLEE